MTKINQDQLLAIFRYLKVPERAYDLGNNTHLDACATIEHRPQGWEVFVAANGEKRDVTVFDNETDACLDLLYKVIHK